MQNYCITIESMEGIWFWLMLLCPDTFQYAQSYIKSHFVFVENLVVCRKGTLLRYASDAVRADEQVAERAIENTSKALIYVRED